MTKYYAMNKKIINIIGFTFIIISIQIFGCVHNIKNNAARKFESYRFNADSSIISRVAAPPEFLLSYLKELDGRKDYTPYQPNSREIRIIENSLTILPPLYRQLLKKKLIGIYFINNFLGNGLTDWVVDSSDSVYTVMVFNSSVFSKNMSDLLTEKEQTCFTKDDISYNISIDCGKKYNGFYYILLHESTHAVDYVMNITPYTEIHYKKYLRLAGTDTDFTRNIWDGYDRAHDRFLFTGHLLFYSSRPQLHISEAIDIYRDLSRSPFVSLYGSLSWAEDLAEMATFYHITHIMKEPFVINVMHNHGAAFSVRPLESLKVKERLKYLKIFYTTGR